VQFEEVIGAITNIETIAAGTSVRASKRLRRSYGGRRWRKKKGVATVRLAEKQLSRFTYLLRSCFWLQAKLRHAYRKLALV
jgi:hypothetical protein